jgi:hypothetical protein
MTNLSLANKQITDARLLLEVYSDGHFRLYDATGIECLVQFVIENKDVKVDADLDRVRVKDYRIRGTK